MMEGKVFRLGQFGEHLRGFIRPSLTKMWKHKLIKIDWIKLLIGWKISKLPSSAVIKNKMKLEINRKNIFSGEFDQSRSDRFQPLKYGQ